MNFALIFADKQIEWNTSQFRIVTPGKALAKIKHGVSLIPVQLFQEGHKDSEEVCSKADIIVVERNLIGDVITKMAYWYARGKVIVANYDDNYEEIESTNIAYQYWHDGTAVVENEKKEQQLMHIFPPPLDQFKRGLKLAYAQVTPSKELCKYFEKYTPAYHLPNYFETGNYINQPKENSKDIVIGWGGSVGHIPSFEQSGVLQAFKNVVEVRPNVKIMIVGDDRIFNKIEIPQLNKIFQPYVNFVEWPKVINKFSIGIAPLAGVYDNFRSIIKPVEFSLTKKPWIASDGPSYHETGKYGTLVENTVDNWTNALLEKIDNLENENLKAQGEPYQWGLDQDVDRNAHNIANVYRRIAKEQAGIEFMDENQ
jgi:hypothetical protein